MLGLAGEVFGDLADQQQALGPLVDGPGVLDPRHHAHGVVIAQVPADPRQRVPDRDADAAQMRRIADAAELQQLRRGHHAARKDHLAPGVYLFALAAVGIFDAGRALAVEQDLRRMGMGDDF